MRLSQIVHDAGLGREALLGDHAIEVGDVVHDSRAVQPGALFCCVPGETIDGHEFASAAVAAGATALLVERVLDERAIGSVPQILVSDSRVAMGRLAAAFHSFPARALTMVGVTGTNGKTTTSSLIASVLQSTGRATGLIGTLTGRHTTPESPDLQRALARFVADGAQAVVMEVSSHAMALHRVEGCHFDVSVFTNLGRDHLDLHGTTERYFAAKAALFAPSLTDCGVVNADDTHGQLLLDAAPIPMTAFDLGDVTDVDVSTTSHSYMWRGVRVRVGIGGRFNVMNSLAAATACAELGVAVHDIAVGLASAPPVPGRFEPIDAGQPFDVIVDFAHTPDGLREALDAARAATRSGRVIVVFGCGGDRDREKRPAMGGVAAESADLVFVTSDNPRSEDPLAIIDAIVAGVPAHYRRRLVIEPDRRQSFVAAFGAARIGDVVVIAGKGHEITQTVAGVVSPFDDRAVARELLGHALGPHSLGDQS